MAKWEERAEEEDCECDDADKFECENFDVKSTTIDGNEACTCPCHRGARSETK